MVREEPPGWGHMADAAFQARGWATSATWWSATGPPSVVVWGTRLNETQNYPGAVRAGPRHRGDEPAMGRGRPPARRRSIPRPAGPRTSSPTTTTTGPAGAGRPPVPGVPDLVNSESVGARILPTGGRSAFRAGQPGVRARPGPTTEARSDIRYAGSAGGVRLLLGHTEQKRPAADVIAVVAEGGRPRPAERPSRGRTSPRKPGRGPL